MELIVEDYWRKFEWFVTRIESIIWSIFTVKVIDYRFRIYCHCDRPSCKALHMGQRVSLGYWLLFLQEQIKDIIITQLVICGSQLFD